VTASTVDPAQVTYSATAVLPYHDVRSAIRGLRSELRHQLALAGTGDPDWTSLALTGPVPVTDGRGRRWFEYTASIRGPGGWRAVAVPQV
jgi:hypothetical protein